MGTPLSGIPHRRLNRLTGEYVLVSPHRTARPWQGQVEDPVPDSRPAYDPDCYLCPGNTRAGGARTARYSSTYVFDNDFAALLPDTAPAAPASGGLLVAEAERGICRVLCFSPRHDLTLGGMGTREIRQVVDAWTQQYTELGAIPWVAHVLIFENRGAMMGASNPHPHGQIWAEERLPNEAVKESARQRAHDGCLLCDYLAAELADGERLVASNDEFVALVPFWAVWPFETLVLPRSHAGSLPGLTEPARDGLADILGRLTRRYDRLFGVTFPYSMGLHQTPTDGAEHPEWHLHGHFYPPLLRSATIRKFMVGYELLAGPQRDITPEKAAEQLRELSEGSPR
ncbi:UDP-glucose--hexose-1-phosphate uridylyltransferase [Actinoplanes sp. NPDC049681]|uniref:UDP-glucose--hexose-1-phosphate uridylyltransferase n=1 Tax=Actinoplanes sp. NPDC049681 TaxID=3363905 RepID=UPI0037A4D53A